MDNSAVRTIRVDGIELPYVEFGQGEPVVLVHGSNSDHRIWSSHCTMLSSRYRVIALSQRYFGKTAWTDAGGRFNISDLADDLGLFVQGLGADPVGNTPEQYTAFMQNEIAKWDKVIKAAGIKGE